MKNLNALLLSAALTGLIGGTTAAAHASTTNLGTGVMKLRDSIASSSQLRTDQRELGVIVIDHAGTGGLSSD